MKSHYLEVMLGGIYSPGEWRLHLYAGTDDNICREPICLDVWWNIVACNDNEVWR